VDEGGGRGYEDKEKEKENNRWMKIRWEQKAR
jgi:hypothetical protein